MREKFESLFSKEYIHKEQISTDGELLISITYAKICNSDIYILYKNDDLLNEFVSSLQAVYGLNVKDTISYDRIKSINVVHGGGRNKLIYIYPGWRRIDPRRLLLKNILSRNGFNKIVWLNISMVRTITNMTHEWVDAHRREYYLEHSAELVDLYNILSDDLSKKTLYEYIKSYLLNMPYEGDQIGTIYKYWYGNEKEEIYRHLNNENWVNCGAYVGDTIMTFLTFGFEYNKILAFEGNKKNYDKLKKNIKEIGKYKDTSRIELYNSFIDKNGKHMDVLQKEKCTLLNADIEGYELDLLKSMKEIIRKDRPVLAICVYHLKEDLIEIPAYIQSIVEGYSFKLRKYTSWIYDTKRMFELVLYAIPNERLIK